MARSATVIAESVSLGATERVEEALFTGLRLTDGIDRRRFLAAHGLDPWTKYGRNLASFMDAGLMWTRGDRFGLTRQGMLVSNEILAVFV